MEKAYKFRIYPNATQTKQIQRTFGCCRFVFNHFLAERKSAFETDGETLGYDACSAELTKLKQELEWLTEPDSTALQSSLKDLDQAYKNFFRRARQGGNPGFPKFKSKRSNRKSYKSKGGIAVTAKHIKLPKLGLVKAAVSKQVQGRILNATVSQNPSGKYFVSVCCTDVDIPRFEPTGKSTGLDMGIKHLTTNSDGTLTVNPKYFIKSENKLAKAQRRLSRKSKGSSNRNKARIRVARVHEHIANQRKDFLHKLTTGLVKEYDAISAETLDIIGMVAQNPYLAKLIYDASWGELQRQLDYKCHWYGKQFAKIAQSFPSSNMCSGCGCALEEHIKLSKRKWTCPQCGMKHDRDVNAARNILNEGNRMLAA